MKQFDQINVIPFIDIMLVLLSIVLLTATFISKQQIDLELPAANQSIPATTSNQEAISLSIDAKEKFYFDGKEITPSQLEKKLETLDKKTPLLLSFDKTVPFEKFIFIIDLLKKYHQDNFSIMVRKP
ncbi:MAG: biopolymer transporter ExbD [Thiotrichaceae bacterium]|nr:biopolymer transporter ExbD [Thiotrichaceae bacterium]